MGDEKLVSIALLSVIGGIVVTTVTDTVCSIRRDARETETHEAQMAGLRALGINKPDEEDEE